MKNMLYSNVLNGQQISVEPSNITIGLSKYPTRNITAVHIEPCPVPPALFFYTKIIFMVLVALFVGGGLLSGINEYDRQLAHFEKKAESGWNREENRMMLIEFRRLDVRLREVITPAVGMLIPLFCIFGFYLYVLLLLPKYNSLKFGNATDTPVLKVPAFTVKEFLKLVFAGDQTHFKMKVHETCTPLIEFRDAIEKAINEIQKT